MPVAMPVTSVMRTTLAVCAVLLVIHGGLTTTTHTRGSKDYCSDEYFNATCPAGQALLVQTAMYGRMAPGHCVGVGYGHIGCSVNVLAYMHARCTARTHCAVYAGDPTLSKMNPCPRGLTAYLRAKYTCVQVAARSERDCRVHGVTRLSSGLGYIRSTNSARRCPWLVSVDPGQTVKLSTLALRSPSGAGKVAAKSLCRRVGRVRDDSGPAVDLDSCGGTGGETVVYTSTSNVVRVTLFPLDDVTEHPFLLKYQAVGCATLVAPPGVTIVSEGQLAVITCNYTLETWNLVCTGTVWRGERGNCSRSGGMRTRSKPIVDVGDESFPYGVLLVVAAGVTLGVVLGGLLLSLAAFYMRRDQRERCGDTEVVVPEENYQQRAYLRDGVLRDGVIRDGGTRTLLFTSRPYVADTQARVTSLPDQGVVYKQSQQKLAAAQSDSSLYKGDSSLKSGHVYESPQFT